MADLHHRASTELPDPEHVAPGRGPGKASEFSDLLKSVGGAHARVSGDPIESLAPALRRLVSDGE